MRLKTGMKRVSPIAITGRTRAAPKSRRLRAKRGMRPSNEFVPDLGYYRAKGIRRLSELLSRSRPAQNECPDPWSLTKHSVPTFRAQEAKRPLIERPLPVPKAERVS